MNILVTGGTGFIGSHTTVELIKNGHTVVIADNLVNSKLDTLKSIKSITGVEPLFYEYDLTAPSLCNDIFVNNSFDAVIHFAGLKAVGESVQKPLDYYRNNLQSTINILECMKKFNCKSFIFSSSATVYGSPAQLPIKEDFPLSTTNPYGSTKLMIEGILKDLYVSDNSFSITLLRYFNPIGAHASALLGENPNGIPNNLMPLVIKAAMGEITLKVYGNDYNTKDGTGVRDYIHVCDLADGHLKALKNAGNPGVHIYNLGTGEGYSVLDIINTFEKVNSVKVPYEITNRRPGDIDACYADTAKAYKEIGFKSHYSLEAMCRDSWNYALKNR